MGKCSRKGEGRQGGGKYNNVSVYGAEPRHMPRMRSVVVFAGPVVVALKI